MTTPEFREVWLGPNDGMGTPKKHASGPHDFPKDSHVKAALNPLEGKSTNGIGSQTEPIYAFTDWLEMSPYQVSADAVVSALGEEFIERVVEGNAAKEKRATYIHGVVSKLVLITSYEAQVDRVTGIITPPDAEHIAARFDYAMSQPSPQVQLDQVITNVSSRK